MKILYLIDNFSLGGAQSVIRGIVENDRLNSNIYIVGLRKKMPETPLQHPNALCLNSHSKYSIRPIFFLKKYIRLNNIEILHCQLPRSVVFGYLIKWLFFPKIKYIIHEQGDIFESCVYALILRTINRKADGFIACSGATKSMLINKSGIKPEKIRVIYNFADLKRFKPQEPVISKYFNIGFAGRIERRKGWREFLKAAQVLIPNNNLKFFIAGAGSEENKIKSFIMKKHLSNVEYVGYKDNIEEFYRLLNLLIIPSHFEPMGMVAIEAMACGLPVLASDVPGLNEVVENERNGWLFMAGSVNQMVGILEKISNISQNQIGHIKKNNIEDVQKFSFHSFETIVQDYYIEIAEK